jgi:hypothetical protein
MTRQHYLIRKEVQESSSFTHIHAGSTVAGAYGRGVALSTFDRLPNMGIECCGEIKLMKSPSPVKTITVQVTDLLARH